ncbi:MAG: thiamine pyrophosphate-dependent enzyme [archaeon]|nr:thiamine pyrophosphate-dependent enzyme [archaeon]
MKELKGLNYEEFFASGHRACAGCGEALAMRHIMKAAGPNTIVTQATGCMEVVSTPYPQSAWRVPWVHGAFENAAAIMSGIDASLKAQGKREGVNLIAIGGDGASFDIGFGALSGALERGHKFTYIATDNEAYMNTGVQRSGATFPFASTTTSPGGKKIHGKQEPKKPLPFIVAAHGIKYVASVTPANLLDLKKKVEKALATDHASFLHIYCVCPVGWHCKSDTAIELSKLAVQTRVFPLYEIEEGVLKFTQKVEKPKPVLEYLELQGRFKHLNEDEVQKIQDYVNARYDFLLSIEGKKAFDVLF